MQKLLLGNYTEVEAFNRARKLHISTTARRAVFLVTTRQSQDEHALATIKNIFSARTHDFITAIDDTSVTSDAPAADTDMAADFFHVDPGSFLSGASTRGLLLLPFPDF